MPNATPPGTNAAVAVGIGCVHPWHHTPVALWLMNGIITRERSSHHRTMNLRAFILAAVLLMPAGQGSFLGGQVRAAVDTEPCRMSCCDRLTAAQGCCCFQAPASAPTSQMPPSLPESGRERAPQPVMTVVAMCDLPSLSGRPSDGAKFHPVAPRSIAASAIALTVLHCAFLI